MITPREHVRSLYVCSFGESTHCALNRVSTQHPGAAESGYVLTAGSLLVPKVTKTALLLCPGLRQGSDFPRSDIAPWVAAKGHPWPSAAKPASLPLPLNKEPHCAISALGRPQVAICVAPTFCAGPENQKQGESGRRLAGEICKAYLLFALDFPASISQTTQNARREAEWRCRGVGRSAWMPSERRWAMDGPSARARPTISEGGTPAVQGLTPAQRFWLLLAPKVTRPSGRNLTQQHPDAVVATRFKAHHSDLRKLQTYKELPKAANSGRSDKPPSQPS